MSKTILETVRESAKDLHDAGIIDDERMSEYDENILTYESKMRFYAEYMTIKEEMLALLHKYEVMFSQSDAQLLYRTLQDVCFKMMKDVGVILQEIDRAHLGGGYDMNFGTDESKRDEL